MQQEGTMAKKILVVDDEKDMAHVLVQRLTRYGYDVSSVNSGLEALKAAKQERFDLIILDILMPVMDGTEVARRLRDDPDTADIPLMFLTVLQTKGKDKGYGLAGPHIIFAKPFDIQELGGVIDNIFEGKIRPQESL